jgi:hypothetical protein
LGGGGGGFFTLLLLPYFMILSPVDVVMAQDAFLVILLILNLYLKMAGIRKG